MKDEDFDNVGKRLYDLEADPPKDGWAKLRPVVAAAPAGKAGWVRRNGWKTLFVVVPVLFYCVYHISSLEGLTTARALELDRSKRADLTQPMNKEKDKASQPAVTNAKSTGNPVLSRSGSSSENSGVRKVEIRETDLQGKEAQVVEETNPQVSPHENIAKNFSNASAKMNDVISEAGTTEQKERAMSDSFLRSGNIATTDSAAWMIKEVQEKKDEEVEIISKKPANEAEDESVRRWRMVAAFAPAFQTRPVKPIVKDDVYVTDVDNSTPVKQIGYGFAFGVGRNFSSDFYLDAQLSYTKVTQALFYTFATGNVDTLLAIQQADNSVLVKPVYEMMDRKVRSTHQYGGLRLMATYYFWSRQRTRFNVNAAVGAQYLFVSTLEESRSGQWNKLSSEPTDRMNYSFMVGAGYNVKVRHGWEFMINPTLSYFLREVKVTGVPYRLNQQFLGINLMVSKTLFNKE